MSRSAASKLNLEVTRSVRGSIAPSPRVGAWADFEKPHDDGGAGYDALADLFLGDVTPAMTRSTTTDDGSGDSSSVRRTRVRGLVIGHLPVMASAWVREYARHLARENGHPSALLRCRDDEAAIELIGPEAPGGHAGSLVGAIREADRHAGAWIVRVDDASEHCLVGCEAIETLTVLTGADEAAIVGTYRSVKALAPQDGGLDRLPPVELVIMGAAPERAKACGERLCKTIETFLGRGVRVSAIIPRINASAGDRVETLYGGPAGDVASTLRVLSEALDGEGPVEGSTSQDAIASPTEDVREFPHESPEAEPDPVVSRLGAVTMAPRETAARRSIAPPEAPRVHVAPAEPAAVTSARPRLSGMIGGLRSLGMICPLAEDVEVAVDARGVLHLLASGDEDASPQLALARVTMASAWATQHRKLLSVLAEREAASLDADATPACHVFSEDARSLRPLPDGSARLHLLVPIRVSADTHWHCSDLN